MLQFLDLAMNVSGSATRVLLPKQDQRAPAPAYLKHAIKLTTLENLSAQLGFSALSQALHVRLALHV
jgi:hypothetical protein